MSQQKEHIPKLRDLLKSRDQDQILAYIREHPIVLDQQDENGLSGLMLIAYHRLPEILARVKDLKSSFDLYEAICCGLQEEVRRILAADPPLLDQHAPDGFTPLALACFFSQAPVAEYLLNLGADPNKAARNASKVAPIHSAVAADHAGLVDLLIRHGADVRLPQARGITPLHAAAHLGNLRIVRQLIEAGAQREAKMETGETALDLARRDGHEEVVQYLSGSD